MKTVIIFILMLLNVNIFAEESDIASWQLIRSNFTYENDLLGILNNDNQYTSGIKFSNVYKLPSTESDTQSNYLSIGLSQQMFTPLDTNATQLITDDRPYAGWLYVAIGYHQRSANELNSWTLQAGVVGPYSLAEESQNSIHELRGLDLSNGWANQLHNEFGLNLMYQHKWKYTYDIFYGMKTNIIPFVSVSLGNIHTFARVGTLFRLGHNPANDFGSSSLDVGGENGIPSEQENGYSTSDPWSYTFNFSAAATAVAQDIFLDGNTLSSSHSVEKKPLLFYLSYGISGRYKNFAVNYILIYNTKQFYKEQSSHQYGSIVFSYLY